MKTFLLGVLLIASSFGLLNAQNYELNLLYTPTTGNLKLLNISGGSVALQTLSILTLGHGIENGGYGPLMSSGIPSVNPGKGALNGAQCILPISEFQTLNTSDNGINGIYSEIFCTNLGSAFLVMPNNSTYNLGNVAPTGWNQSIINQVFITNPEVAQNGELNYGFFLYATTTGEFKTAPILINTETSIGTNTEQNIAIFYNKIAGAFTINGIDKINSTHYQIINSAGQIINSGVLSEENSIPANDLSNGIYFVKIEQNGVVVTKRIIKN